MEVNCCNSCTAIDWVNCGGFFFVTRWFDCQVRDNWILLWVWQRRTNCLLSWHYYKGFEYGSSQHATDWRGKHSHCLLYSLRSILNALTTLILLFGCVAFIILPTVSSISRAVLRQPKVAVFVWISLFCLNLVLQFHFRFEQSISRSLYQVRRSGTASHLLEAKWLIAKQPSLVTLGGEVAWFGTSWGARNQPSSNVVLVQSPGLGDLKFEREDIYFPMRLRQTGTLVLMKSIMTRIIRSWTKKGDGKFMHDINCQRKTHHYRQSMPTRPIWHVGTCSHQDTSKQLLAIP